MSSRGRISKAVMTGVGARITALRIHLGRNPGQFALLVGADAETVEAWERGTALSRDDLVRIADRTGASLMWLISGLSSASLERIRASAFAGRHRAAEPAGAACFA